jgi:hypothetical protein
MKPGAAHRQGIRHATTLAVLVTMTSCGGHRALVPPSGPDGSASGAADAAASDGAADRTSSSPLDGLAVDSRPIGSCPLTPPPSPRPESGAPLCAEPCPGEWQAVVAIDDSGCSSRTALDCGPLGSQGGVYLVLSRLFSDCRVPSYTFVRVDFADRCARRLLVTRLRGPDPGIQPLVDCLKDHLVGQRWACATDSPCGVLERDTLR